MNRYNILKTACLSLLIGLSSSAKANTSISIKHLANEQNIVTLKTEKKFLLLPVQDNAPEGKVYIIKTISQFWDKVSTSDWLERR